MAFMSQLLHLCAARCWRKNESKIGDVFEQTHLMHYAVFRLQDPKAMMQSIQKDYRRRHRIRLWIMVFVGMLAGMLFSELGIDWFPRLVAFAVFGVVFSKTYLRPTMQPHWRPK